jgi:hypothetical protein
MVQLLVTPGNNQKRYTFGTAMAKESPFFKLFVMGAPFRIAITNSNISDNSASNQGGKKSYTKKKLNFEQELFLF